MKIVIANQEWVVDKVPPHDPSLFVDGGEVLGSTWLAHLRICIAGDLKADRAKRTIKHELCHAYIYSTQANRPDTWDEEAICEFFGIYSDEINKQANEIYKALFLVDVNLVE